VADADTEIRPARIDEVDAVLGWHGIDRAEP